MLLFFSEKANIRLQKITVNISIFNFALFITSLSLPAAHLSVTIFFPDFKKTVHFSWHFMSIIPSRSSSNKSYPPYPLYFSPIFSVRILRSVPKAVQMYIPSPPIWSKVHLRSPHSSLKCCAAKRLLPDGSWSAVYQMLPPSSAGYRHSSPHRQGSRKMYC